MLTPRVTVIKTSQIAHFFLFSADESKTLVRVQAKSLSAPQRYYWDFSENEMFNRLWSYHSWNAEGRNIRKTAELVKNIEILYFQWLTSC